ncbi:MAG: Ig-like domain-containing protein, partial [Actinomycetes bacterium]
TNAAYRAAVNQRFATNTNAPAPGLTLFRFSTGHGGLYCSACHGSTHAEFPSAFTNDNLASIQFQGHEGMRSECTHCHRSAPSTVNGGPHGLHPIGVPWINGHKEPGKSPSACAVCHGNDQRGTVLSRSQMNWSVSLFDRQYTYTFWRGQQIGCHTCHQGSNNTDHNPNLAPVAQSFAATTPINTPLVVVLPISDANTLTYRIVHQAAHGRVGLIGSIATYYPDTAFTGTDSFTFAAWDGSTDSNLGVATVTVSGGSCSYVINPSSQTFSELGQVGSVQVTAGASCGWSAASESLWLSLLSPSTSASGSGSVAYSLDRNFGANDRTGTLTIADMPFTVIQAGAPADTNGDGIPDSWQTAYFGSVASTNAVPGADPDADGMSNLNEYLAGTNPTNSTSVLRIVSLSLTGTNQPPELTFVSLLRHWYQVEWTADLLNPDWAGYTNAVYGTGATLPVTGPVNTNSSQMFYRVQLVP